MIGSSFFYWLQVSQAPHVYVVNDSAYFLCNDALFSGSLVTHAHTLLVAYLLLTLFLVFSPCGRNASFVLCSDDGQMDTPLEAHMNPKW